MAPNREFDVAPLAAEIGTALGALTDQKTATARALRREYSRRLAGASGPDVVALALRLLERPEFASRFIAYELVAHHREALGSLKEAELLRLGRGLDGWGAVDTFACYLAGPAWREQQVPDALIHRWARSPDRWWRRAALVCTAALNNKARGGRGDTPGTLAICRQLVDDRDDMVVKALSWALRELAKRDPAAAEAFVSEYEATLAARVLREVRSKLRTGRKNPPRGARRPAESRGTRRRARPT
jgi:3-methyladenine DNA glycosylase AlkD